MPWTRKTDPLAPTPPAYHHPDRCMNCGHLDVDHHDEVGCMVEGGTKYMEDEDGNAMRACTCEAFVPAPEELIEAERQAQADVKQDSKLVVKSGLLPAAKPAVQPQVRR